MGRTKSIIAVFGSDDTATIGKAESLGRAVVEKGSVLLTGGGKDLDAATVKDRAMRGARSAEQDGHPAPRVGVLGKEAEVPAFTRQNDLTSLVFLSLGYGDRRNYAEACMSDAVVAFQGGAGTKSEVAFALSLGRPVFLVGERWGGEFPVVRDEVGFKRFRELAKGRADAKGEETIDKLVSDAYRELTWDADYAVTWKPLGSDVDSLADDVRAAAQDCRLPGRLPTLPERAEICADYEKWLDQIDQRS